MLKKVSPDEVDSFQAYTIINLDSKLSIGSDIDQYRLMSITEDPITNKQQHLDVMCFPVLFPTGKFAPTLFLTFSCAEYESPDITEFLRKVNNVPHNMGKLCVEDPISVSRNFPLKFSFLCQKCHFERLGPGYCRPLLLEEGISKSWGSSLPCPALD